MKKEQGRRGCQGPASSQGPTVPGLVHWGLPIPKPVLPQTTLLTLPTVYRARKCLPLPSLTPRARPGVPWEECGNASEPEQRFLGLKNNKKKNNKISLHVHAKHYFNALYVTFNSHNTL